MDMGFWNSVQTPLNSTRTKLGPICSSWISCFESDLFIFKRNKH